MSSWIRLKWKLMKLWRERKINISFGFWDAHAELFRISFRKNRCSDISILFYMPHENDLLASLAHCVVNSMINHFSISLSIPVPITQKKYRFCQDVGCVCLCLCTATAITVNTAQRSVPSCFNFMQVEQNIFFCDYHSLASRRTWRLHLWKLRRCLFTSREKNSNKTKIADRKF